MPEERIGIYFRDATYGREGESETESRRFQSELESEFKHTLQCTDIGVGAADPAFVMWLVLNAWPYLAGGLLLFFQGKRISENLDAWAGLYKKLKTFSRRKPKLDRDGAAVAAYDGIATKLGRPPRCIRLTGYCTTTFFDQDLPAALSQIAEAPHHSRLGMVTHVFQIEVDDGTNLQVFVDGLDVKVVEGP